MSLGEISFELLHAIHINTQAHAYLYMHIHRYTNSGLTLEQHGLMYKSSSPFSNTKMMVSILYKVLCTRVSLCLKYLV